MSKTLTITHPLVSVDWLNENINADNLVVLDATMNKPLDASQKQIPNARYFDIKNRFSNTTDPFPNTFPSPELFQEESRLLGICNDSVIVVYDDKGIYSSARVWWLFKAFGYDNVAVLNGGFPAWTKAGYRIEPLQLYNGETGDFTPNLQPNLMKFFNDIKAISKNKSHQIIDARSAGRFNCEEPEPRAGLRMGIIPNSVNLPYTDLLEDGMLKDENLLKQKFDQLADTDDPLVFSCGSGITACVLALGAEISGYNNISVYDGSWTEWGTLVKE